MDSPLNNTDENNDGLSDTVMSVIWTGGRFGAAYYELDTGEVSNIL